VDKVLSVQEERETREWAARQGYNKKQQDALVRYVRENIEERRRRTREAVGG